MTEPDWKVLRQRMVDEQLRPRGIRNPGVLAVMGRIPRHEFMPVKLQNLAYNDHPVPIGHEQTISQPFMVAVMTEVIRPRRDMRVLEVGTGSGYQTAVLASLVHAVYTVELVPELAARAEALLRRLGYRNVHAKTGDGSEGWPSAAPFDAIVVTCGADHVPEPLARQLKPGATMVIPVGDAGERQKLRVLRKKADGTIKARDLFPVQFVPLRRGR